MNDEFVENILEKALSLKAGNCYVEFVTQTDPEKTYVGEIEYAGMNPNNAGPIIQFLEVPSLIGSFPRMGSDHSKFGCFVDSLISLNKYQYR